MARDRPPSNWSGSSNPDRDVEGREQDGWSTDGSTHDGHVSQSGMPDVSGAGPETNAFLWALEGESDPFADNPVPQFTGAVDEVQTSQSAYEQDNQIEQRFDYAPDDGYPGRAPAPEAYAPNVDPSLEVDGPSPAKQFFPDTGQSRQDFYEDGVDEVQYPQPGGLFTEGLENRNVDSEQLYQRNDRNSGVYEEQPDVYIEEEQFNNSSQTPYVEPLQTWNGTDQNVDSDNGQHDYYPPSEDNSGIETSSRGGFDDEDDAHPSGSFEHIEAYDPSMSGQFSERDYDFSHEYSEEQLRLPSHENIGPPQHREPETWFNQPDFAPDEPSGRNGFDVEVDDYRSGVVPVADVDDYRSGIERDVVSDEARRVRAEPIPVNPNDDYDYYDDYQDEVIEQPRSKQVRRPGRSRRRAEGYVVEDKTKSHKLRDQIVEIVFLVVPTILLVLLVRSFVVSPFLVPTSSMEPTLEIGDRVLVNKLSYRVGDVGRGDIVVVRLDTDTGEKAIIKRAIGLPGETVEIRDNKVIINGKLALEESDYLGENVTSADFGPVRIPSDELFLLGDNREISDDSSKDLGPVPIDRVVGRAFVRFWPMGRFGSL